MIKQIYVCECDICGAIENAKATTWRNETEYEIPDNWVRGNNKKICICPECNKKLNAKVEEPKTLVTPNMQFAPMYGCPAPYEVCTPTIGFGVTVDPVIISADIPNTESQVVLDSSTNSVLDCARQLKNWCKKYSNTNCNDCVLHCQADQHKCVLTLTDVKDWNDDLDVADVLTWIGCPKESKAAKELINYCKDNTCDSSCMFYTDNKQCKLTCFDVKDWDLSTIESKTVLDINKCLRSLKTYCGSLDSCKECPIAYFEEKSEYYSCSLTDTPVFEWQDIVNKLKDEHKILAEYIEAIANHCKTDMGNCEDCRYCRSYERCDLRLHNPVDWIIYDDNNK